MPDYFSRFKKNYVLRLTAMFVFLISFSLIFFVSCGKKKKEGTEEAVYSEDTARVVSHVTSGIISPGDRIYLRFVDPVAAEEEVGNPVPSKVFDFDPGIPGQSKWEDRRTVVFVPSKKLPFHQEYTGNAGISELNDGFAGLPPVKFSFRTTGRELEALSGDFELVREDNPDILKYIGEVRFTEDIAFDLVKKYVSFISEKGKLPLLWSEKSAGRSFVFTTGTISRKTAGGKYIVKVDREGTDITDNVVKQIRLEPLKKFKITDVIKFDKGQRPGLEIRFAHKLKKGQDVKGLIRLEPPMDIVLKSMEKSVFVEGDFKFGEQYTVKVMGVRSKWGGRIEKEVARTVIFEDKKPQISFSSGGIYLPSSEQRKLTFRTLNVKKVRVVVKRVYESNLGQFLQTESLAGGKSRSRGFGHYDMNRVGVKVAEKTLEIGTEKNRWLTHQLDMKELISEKDKGIFVVEITFKRKDMLYSGLKKKAGYYYGKDYYSNPNSHGYIYRHGKILKPVLVSDIGLTYKRGGGEHFVFASNLIDSAPESGVKVTLRTYQNQPVQSGETDGDGKVFFKGIKDNVFFVEAEKDGQKSVIKPTEMKWNLSSYDTGGVVSKADGTRAFIYTERGVYRPGDSVNLSVIARNSDGTFPENHPAVLELYNPRNQLVRKTVQKTSRDGFYHFRITTADNDPTGNWRAKLLIGGTRFFHTLKIETVVPFKLKVNLLPGKKKLGPGDDVLRLSLSSKYLFGSPSPLLDADIMVLLRHIPKTFKKFKGFSFSNELRSFRTASTTVFEGKLDSEGKAEVDWNLPPLNNVPSSIRAEITAKVLEKGGRPNTGGVFIPVDPYKNYVGLQRPRLKYGYSRVGSKVNIHSVLVSREGETISGRPLRYRIYRNARYWWWEYDNLAEFRVRYKKDNHTKIVKEGTYTSKNIPVPVGFTPEQPGEYFIEVEEDLKPGHKAGFFFSSYYWGDSPTDLKDAGSLALRSDRKKYHPGDTARITFPKPEKGTLLATLEKGDRILKSWVRKLKGEDALGELEVPVTGEMLPNAYISISIIQPHSQTGNDRPIRVYGTIPLMVEDASTRKNIEIVMDDQLEPNRDFEVTVRTGDGSNAQFTIAVVDEGLLDLTRFRTPDPWRSFFSKQKLGISTYDLFAHVLSVNKGDVYRLFSIGGEMEAMKNGYRSSQMEPGKSKRFKPVSMFKGPLSMGGKGEKKVKFRMPDYIGAVRVMVVTAEKYSFGSKEKSVPVKTDLMVLPALPRVLGPGDTVVVPVTVFAMSDKVKQTAVAIETEGNIRVAGDKKKKVVFRSTGEQDVAFRLKAANSVGPCRVTVKAVSGRFRAEKTVDIHIRPSSPRIYSSEKKEGFPGQFTDFTIPDRGLKGTNRASVVISRKARLDIERRLSWLIHYPYGCIEQTVSAVFPQLYLKEFIRDSNVDLDDVDGHINSAIRRLRKFALSSGGFSYWPGNRDVSLWGTNYAHHFLVEAEKRGYNVPADLLGAVLRFQKSQALVTSDLMLTRIYRLYVLALAGEAQVGPMNLIVENSLSKTTHVEKWMLSAAYFLAGKKDAAKRIRKGIDTSVPKYKYPGRTFGSPMRDRAIILEALTLFEDWNKADLMYDEMVADLSGGRWFSTQTLGYSLLSLGKYLMENKMDLRGDDTPISGYVQFPDRKKIPFEFNGLKKGIRVPGGFGKKLKVFIDDAVKAGKVYVTLQWDGIPLKSVEKDLSDNLVLDVTWLNEEGKRIDPSLIRQGTQFWGHFRVRPGIYSSGNLTELALVQIIPAGWEIENIRLTGEEKPPWMKKWVLGREAYTDIRDDRIMWFFDMPGRSRGLDFTVKINAVTAGKFLLPPTVFEAMYNNRYRAVKKGRGVEVISRALSD